MLRDEVESDNLRYDPLTGRVTLLLRGGEVSIGTLADCEDELPRLLLAELAELRQEVKDQEQEARDYAATLADAERARFGDPRGWR